MKTEMHRQGDVMLVRVDTLIPENATEIPTDNGRVVLAYGEVTGHAHAIDSRLAKMYRWEGDRLLEIGAEDAELKHEEHKAIPLPAGSVWKVLQQREFSSAMIRTVAD